MNKCMDYRSSYMSHLYKARNLEDTMNEKRQAYLTMYAIIICQYKALLKKHFVEKDTFNEVDKFCWQLRDGINEIVENHIKYDHSSNLSTKEKRALHKLIAEKK